MQVMIFLSPLDALIQKSHFHLLQNSGVTTRAQGSVPAGFCGARQLSLFLLRGLGGVLAYRARAGHLFLTIPHLCLFLPPLTKQSGVSSPPPPLYKLRPCPSYSRRRDCNNFVRNLVMYEM